MAGVFELDYRKFLPFNTLGVLIGIGEFVVIGYFFGAYLHEILAWIERFGIAVVAVALIGIVIFWRSRLAAASNK
jgi:membrane-associated protein